MQIQVSKLTDVSLLRKACGFTIDRESKIGLDSIYRCEHSPCRTQIFCVEMRDIATFVSVHLVRHKFGVEHFVKSNRDDRGGVPADRNTPVNHMMFINAQALIQMARKRLCSQAHVATQEVMEAIKLEVAKVDPDLARYMVAECEYRNGYCPELKPCGRNQQPEPEKNSPFTFPPALKFITGEYTGQNYVDKLREEVDELATEINRFNHTQGGNLHNLLMEAWDVVHVAETYIRRICQTHGIDPAASRGAVVYKNAARGYYDELVVKPPIMDCAGIRCDQCDKKAACSVK